MEPTPQDQSSQLVPPPPNPLVGASFGSSLQLASPPANPLKGAAFGPRIIIPAHVRDLKNAVRQLCVDTGANSMQFLYKGVLIGKIGQGNTMTPTASCTKSVVAITMFKLQEMGMLDLDQPVCQLLKGPGWQHFSSGGYEKITTRHLLTHTSGLPGNKYFLPEDKSHRIPGDKQFLNHLAPSYDRNLRAGMHPLHYRVGSFYDYSNPGTQLLAAVAAQALIRAQANCTVSEFIEKESFKPLGMTNSFIMEENGIPIFNGGMVSTTDDLVKLGQFIFNLGQVNGSQILSPATVIKMLKPPLRKIPNAEKGYGHLWRRNDHFRSFAAIGDLANAVWILPDDDIIISRTHPVPAIPPQPEDERLERYPPFALREAFALEIKFWKGFSKSMMKFRGSVTELTGNALPSYSHRLSALFQSPEQGGETASP